MLKACFKTNKGNIVIELFEAKAPETVRNFVEYIASGFYDGLIFHRVIDGFMIQGGGFDLDGNEKESKPPIKNEAKNMLSNEIGTIAMARTNDPHSATCQFFINVANNTFLNYQSSANWGYCVFGKVIEGMDVVNEIKKVETRTHPRMYMQDWPVEDIVIEKATIV